MLTFIQKYIKLFNNKLKGHDTKLNQYDNALFLLDNLSEENFINFNSKENSTLQVRSIYKNITIYNSKLKEVTSYLSQDKVVYNGWCLEPEAFVFTNDFFLTNDSQYIDENNHIKDFKMLALVFLTFYYEHSLLVTVGEHNRRVLTNFTNGLINTIEDLVSIVKT